MYRDSAEWATSADIEVVLHEIYYANQRYYVHFETGTERKDYEASCLEWAARCAVDRKRLNAVRIYYNASGSPVTNPATLELVRGYELNYAGDANPVLYPQMAWLQEGNVLGYTLTLTSVVEKGKNNGALPPTSFGYSDFMHLTDVENGYKGKVHLAYDTTTTTVNPWPFAGAAGNEWGQSVSAKWYSTPVAAPHTWGVKMVPTHSYGDLVPVAPGKMIWMSVGVNITPQNISFSIASDHWATLQTSVYASGPGQYSAVLKMPQDVRDILSFTFGNSMEIDNEQIGVAVTRYRVTQRTVYPNIDTPSLFYAYIYSYNDANGNDTASLNTPALTDVVPSSDYAKDKVIHRPYSEFRGHGTVKVTRPDGAYTITHYYQTDALAGQIKDTTLYRADGLKISATMMGDGSAGSDYHKITIPSETTGANAVTLPQCGSEACKDAKIYWTAPKLVEKRVYSLADNSQYVATRTAYNYALSALSTATPPSLPPVYELRSVVESEKIGSNWTAQRKQFSTYTGTDVATDARYFVGHPSSTAVCSPNGSETNAEYQICGISAGDYYGFTSYTYNTLGQISEAVNLLNFTGAPTTSYTNRYSDFTKYTYDATYGYLWKVEQGYKDQNTPGVTQRTTEYCYKAETSGAMPDCTDYSGPGVNGVYLSWVKNALNQVTHYRSSAQLGLPTQQIDPNGAVTSVSYDEFGRVVTVQKPGESGSVPTIQFAYNAPTTTIPYFWTEAIQKLDETSTYRVRKFYNGIGELIQTQQIGRVTQGAQTTDGLTVAGAACGTTCMIVSDQKTGYVSGVKTTTQTMPYAVTTQTGYYPPTWADATVTTYDVLDRPVTISAPDQTASSFSYGLDGNLQKTTATDAENHITYSWKDAWGRTVKVLPPAGAWLTYEYDAADRLTVVKQFPSGGTTAFATTTITYDVAGRKTQMVDPNMGTWVYTYDAAGNMLTQRDAKLQTVWFGYDALNRLIQKRETSSSGALLASYSYDQGDNGIGRRSSMSAGDGTVQSMWSYDARGRVTQQTDVIAGVGAYTTAWSYNSADRVTNMTYPSGEVVNYTHLLQGGVSQVASSQAAYLTGASYDASGRAIERLLGNGVKNTWSYNAWIETNKGGRLSTAQAYKTSAPTPRIQDLSYSGYDKVGNLTDLSDVAANETLHFDYDALNRLNAVSGAYSDNPEYDPRGNLSQKMKLDGTPLTLSYPTGTAPARPHAAQSVGSSTFQYDANGSMTQRVVGGVTYTLTYDIQNRLTSISGGGLSASYTYNADGARIKAVVTTGGVTRTTGYVGDYFEISLGQPRASAPGGSLPNCALPRRCVFFPMANSGLILYPGQAWYSYYFAGSSRIALRVKSNQLNLDDGVFYFLSDHLGGTAITLNDSGVKTAELRYTAWGETRYTSGSTPTQRRYTGQLEAEAGLYFYNARWYDAARGSFLSADAIVPCVGGGNIPNAAGYLANANYSALVVDYYKNQFLEQMSGENHCH